MPSHRSLSFAPLAQRDIDAVTSFTFERWGSDQTRLYLAMIYDELHCLLSFPEAGRVITDVNPPARALVIGSHVAIYRVTEEEVRILRVLHERQVTRQMLESI